MRIQISKDTIAQMEQKIQNFDPTRTVSASVDELIRYLQQHDDPLLSPDDNVFKQRKGCL